MEKELKQTFKMIDLGNIKLYWGTKFIYKEEGIFVSQHKHIQHLLKRFRMENCCINKVLMNEGTKLCCDMETVETNEYEYRSLVGSLLYLTHLPRH